ncbi:MAG TPA: hypothetical protein VF808_11515 [Ktedonobacterales bacterium]
MATYLQRYLDGERETVWAELMSLGPNVRGEAVFSDAQAVARETMLRARANVEILVERLTTLGYQFVSEALSDDHPAHVPPTAASLAALRALEDVYGPLPLAIETWHEIVGAVDFMGAYPRLSAYERIDPGALLMSFRGQPVRVSVFPEARILGPATPADLQPNQDPTSDPLVVWPCIEALVDEAPEQSGEDVGGDTERFSLCIAPDALHKANTSGGDGPHIAFGDSGMDAPMSGDDWEGVPFVAYLRIAFAWGGFPGLRNEPNPPRDLLAHLCEGLLPL